ncbi:efflux RND transporter periplasmic adaptor subunit [uncultured Paracoccus sp.]|uniref:efflux RND transporter periplasmic adaptor subunit n=1 Tax=uncultured Paracoccus sp. TaxID=189685 RepID=UPI0026300558|nr:efflux RND transporter periplasmic adaptor subunit [uncultured Paracoccus sp.]
MWKSLLVRACNQGRIGLLIAAIALPPAASTAQQAVEARSVTDWKAVYGRVEPRVSLPARARIGGTLTELTVQEGDRVTVGQEIAQIVDDKIDIQIAAAQSQRAALASQLANAQTEQERNAALVERGVATRQQRDALATQVQVLQDQIAAQEAQIRLIEQQRDEGAVLSPVDGTVVTVPQAVGAIVMPGEPVATIGGGGFFLRLAVPERHAGALTPGAAIRLETADGEAEGRLAKIYPQIENGRVVADVEVPDLDARFVDARMLVRVPVGERRVLAVPEAAVMNVSGLDMVTVATDDGPVRRLVLRGESIPGAGGDLVEVVSGLREGDLVYPDFAQAPAPEPSVVSAPPHE